MDANNDLGDAHGAIENRRHTSPALKGRAVKAQGAEVYSVASRELLKKQFAF
jgi:hypothetical protein